MSENKADPAQEALKPLAAISLWRDKYQDGPDMLSNDKLARYFTADQVRAARAALAAPQPAADRDDLVNMLWTWFEDRGHDLREERTYGITSEEFRIMLDEHEANLLPDEHKPPQPAAPLGGRDEIAAFLFARDEACISEGVTPGLLQWGRGQISLGKNAVHSGDCTKECHSCARCAYEIAVRDADAILAIPQERGVDRAAIIAECAKAAHQAFEEQHVLIGPGDMAMAMLNSIRALAGKETGR